MRRIVIDIESATEAELREQCKLLDITIRQGDTINVVRGKLANYYSEREQWINLSDRIFGACLPVGVLRPGRPTKLDHSCDTIGLIEEIISKFLFPSLNNQGYVDKQGKKGKSIIIGPEADTCMRVVGRHSTTELDVVIVSPNGESRIETRKILDIAAAVFSDIADIVAAWEKWKTDGKK